MASISASPLRPRDETTILRFRYLLEKHDLGGLMLEAVNVHLEAKGIKIQTGRIVDATIIHAPSSTKNSAGERDPEMRQTRKSKQRYFGLKAHIGVDAKEGTVHTLVTTRLPTWRTRRRCSTCCTARNARCGATAATRVKPRRSGKPLRRRRT